MLDDEIEFLNCTPNQDDEVWELNSQSRTAAPPIHRDDEEVWELNSGQAQGRVQGHAPSAVPPWAINIACCLAGCLCMTLVFGFFVCADRIFRMLLHNPILF